MVSMKRDKKLILEILLFAEQYRKPEGNALVSPELNGYEPEYVREHVILCEEAGFLESTRDRQNRPGGGIARITWRGHEYLDANRGRVRTCPE